MNTLLEQRLAFMLGTFEQARVKLRTEFDPALVAVHADADQIWEAVLNLVQNSLEAMPDGGELFVSTRREDKQIVVENGGYIECDSVEGRGSTFTIFLPLTEGS